MPIRGTSKFSEHDNLIIQTYKENPRASNRVLAEIIHEKLGISESIEGLRKYIPKVIGEKNNRHTSIRPVSPKLKNSNSSKTSSNEYVEKFVLSAWNKTTGLMMNIDTYCEHYQLPREDITSYKLVSHTGTPYYNIVFKENVVDDVMDIDFDSIVEKYISRESIVYERFNGIIENDFDSLTYTDVHIGMETDKSDNSLYPAKWDKEEALTVVKELILDTIKNKKSDVLYVDELGDFLDGYNAQTTRGGHDLPQNMTNEQAFDCAVEFKMTLLEGLVRHYKKIIFNNICNDNHSGSFGYFANSAFKSIAEMKYPNIEVYNHRRFINHYYAGRVCFVISHGKDDSTLKFGFKPQLDPRGTEKIDQYCKQNDIYKNCDLVIFKKGDSHQALFDMCTSDDFYYFNYPALSPGSQWVTTNFKKGRRGFVNESFKGTDLTQKIKFIK